MMKLLALSLVTLMSTAAFATDFQGPNLFPGGPGHGPGGPPPPGPGGPFPPGPGDGPGGPFPGPFSDPCNMTYDGGYDRGAPMTLELRTDRFGSVATLYLSGQVWRARANCDRGGFNFDIVGYQHEGQFFYRPWGVEGMQGTEYYRGRPYQRFSARVRH